MKKLFCENIFCIYQREGECILADIHLDIQGDCTDCIYVNIDEDFLNDAKQKQYPNHKIY